MKNILIEIHDEKDTTSNKTGDLHQKQMKKPSVLGCFDYYHGDWSVSGR